MAHATNVAVSKSLEAVLARTDYAENTRRAYLKDIARFLQWGGSIPATPETIRDYIVAHKEINRSTTLKRWLASIRLAHRSIGEQELPTEAALVRKVLKDIKTTEETAKRKVVPITKLHIIGMVETTDKSLQGLRDKALLLTGYHGALRRSELARLTVDDILFQEKSMILRLVHPENRENDSPAMIEISMAKCNKTCCAVEAMRMWLRAASIREGAVFRAINRHGKVAQAPLSPTSVATIVKKLAKAAGFDERLFSGHSMRSGFVKTASSSGKSYDAIKAISRHKCDATLAAILREAPGFDEVANDFF